MTKRVQRCLAVLVSSVTVFMQMAILPMPVFAGAVGGSVGGKGGSYPGPGSGGGIIVGLKEIPNAVTDRKSLETNEKFKTSSTGNPWQVQGADNSYVGDYYMSMLKETAAGWDSNKFDPSWVQNEAALVTYNGFGTRKPSQVTVYITGSDGGVPKVSANASFADGNNGYTRPDWGSPVDIAANMWCWQGMTQLIDTTARVGATGSAAGTKKTITFGDYTLSFDDKSDAMADTWVQCVLEGSGRLNQVNIAGAKDQMSDPAQKIDVGGGVSINLLAHSCECLSRALFSQMAENPGTVFNELNAFYQVWHDSLQPVEIQARLSGYNMLMLAAVARFQIFVNPAIRPQMEQYLKEMWKYRNADGSKNFYVVTGFMVAGQRVNSTDVPMLFSYPAALSSAIGGAYSIDTYNNIMNQLIWDGTEWDYIRKMNGAPMPENMPADQEAVYSETTAHQLSGIGPAVAKGVVWMYNYFSNYYPPFNRTTGHLKYTGGSQGYWKMPYCFESALYLRDVKGNRMSTLGTFIYTGPTGEKLNASGADHGHTTTGKGGGGGGGEVCCPPGKKPDVGCDEDDPNYPDCEEDPEIIDGCDGAEEDCDPNNPPPPELSEEQEHKPENPSLSVSTTPERKKCEQECDSLNNVTIDISLSADPEAISKTWAYYEELKKIKPNAKMKMRVDLNAVPLMDDPVDQDYWNTFTLGTSDYHITSGTGTAQRALETNPFDDLATLTQYLNGSKAKLQFIDTSVTVCDKVINNYYAKAHVCFIGDAIDLNAEPNGEESDGDWAYDRSILYVNEDPYYYSAMRHVPVAEIKADEPYSERYEAMAGVPTTEDLYFGAGATEYMVNVDLKWRTEKAQRIYKFTVTNSNCYANNKGCEFSCSGHGPGETCPGPAACGGPGCGGTHYRNSNHPNTCTYTVTIKQPIEDYSYMDIIAEELYRLEYIDLHGNGQLHENSQIHLDPNLGYYSFHDQEGYSSGNGRLHFNVEVDSMSGSEGNRSSTEVKKSALWGDSNFTMSNNIGTTHGTCISKAVSSINTAMAVLSDTYVKVVSDYVVLETSEGYQHIAFFQQDSQHENIFSQCKVDASMFGGGSIGDATSSTSWSKEFTTTGLKFNEIKTQEQMWDNNGLCAAKWDPTDVTTTGYNGEYTSPNDKYDNSNSTRPKNEAQLFVDDEQPNLKKREGDTSFHSGHGANPRYLETDLNIHDSTVVKSLKGTTLHGTMIPLNGWQNFTDNYVKFREWSSNDKIKPVTNGEWNTGRARVKYTQDVKFKRTAGTSYARWCSEREAPYSPEHDKINNIVIHNPISNRDAVLISNDAKYDDRYWGEMERLPAPKRDVKCPRNSGCEFSKLTCNKSQLHNTSCYIDVESGYNCGYPKNAHRHTDDCNKVYKHSLEGTDYYGTNGTAYWVASDDGGFDSTIYTYYPEHEYWIVSHEGTEDTGPWYHIYDYTTDRCYSCDLKGSMHVDHDQCHTKVARFDLEASAKKSGGFTAQYACDPSQESGMLKVPQEHTAKGTDGNNYFLDVPGVPAEVKYFYLYKNPNSVFRTVAGQGEVKDSYEIWTCDVDPNRMYHLVIRYYHRDGTMGGIRCLSCESGDGALRPHSTHDGCHTYITHLNLSGYEETPPYLNTHNHTASCNKTYTKVVRCTDPHHYSPGENHDINDAASHYPFADTRCYTPCGDDSKHNPPEEIKLPDNSAQKPTGNAFINVDRDFQIYYPDVGDFEQVPGMLGISECTDTKGKGYVNNTDTAVWIRNKFFMIPTNVIDSAGNYWYNSEPIDLLKLPIVYTDATKNQWNDSSSRRRGLHIYTFTCVSLNAESNGSTCTFLTVATNAPEQYVYNDALSFINFDRGNSHKAKMSVKKTQIFDIVGSIGSLTIHDVGDPRFAQLFKNPLNNGHWLIPNVVQEVDYNSSNYILSDHKDVRLEPTGNGVNADYTAIDAGQTRGSWHNTYGAFNKAPTGNKNHVYKELPLTSLKNVIPALNKEQMRPGYNLYMDIETLGMYWGENTYTNNDASDKVLHMQRNSDGQGSYEKYMWISPTYYELDLATGKYTPVDVYMKSGQTYAPVYLTDRTQEITEYYNYLDWLNESARRGMADAEWDRTINVQKKRTNEYYVPRVPTSDRDVIGTPRALFLLDLDRTFIGSPIRYGVDQDVPNRETGSKGTDRWYPEVWYENSQRWHFTLGLPSSCVFVYRGTKPSNMTKFQEDIKKIQNKNAVIVCTINIRVRGQIWTLEYDGTALNQKGITVPYGDTPKDYQPPKQTDDPHWNDNGGKNPPDPNKPVKDPIVVIYDNKRTAADDMQTEGTH